jgi:hypothetical protein
MQINCNEERIKQVNNMMMWSPWATLSRGGIAVKATFVTLVLIAALASTFLGKEVESTNERSMLSLAERFVNEASTSTQKKRDMTIPEQLRRLQENKRKDRKRTTFDGQSMAPYSGTDEEDCTSRFCQKQLSDACLVEYKVNNDVPPTITMVLVCEGSRWVGIGFSETGKMMLSDAVLGIPGTTPKKYRLGGYDKSTITLMEKDRQTLIDASLNYDDADDVTVLKFTKIMKEDGEVEIKTGKNTFLYAKGIFEDLNYHQERDLFELTIPEVNVVLDMAPPADGEEESSEKKRKDRDKKDDTSDGEEESSEKKRKDRDKKDDTSAEEDSSTEKQSQESKRKQGDGSGGPTLAEQFAALAPIQLRPVKDLRPQLSPPSQPGDNYPYPYPKIRFTAWENISPQTKEIMKENFGYSKGDWNALGKNENERMTCSQLTDTQRQAIQLLGWNCDVWDCFINHYKSYTAKQMEENDLAGHVDVVRSAWVKLWVDLTEEELQSANRLCFNQILWDVGYLGAA